jgi:hypothetical protein
MPVTRGSRLLAALLALLCGDCLPAMQLNHTVMAYDTMASETVCRQLLLDMASTLQNESREAGSGRPSITIAK